VADTERGGAIGALVLGSVTIALGVVVAGR